MRRASPHAGSGTDCGKVATSVCRSAANGPCKARKGVIAEAPFGAGETAQSVPAAGPGGGGPVAVPHEIEAPAVPLSRIDEELMPDIHDFVEARESMIPHLGMQSYANIMSPFANGERLLNRAWSASADGYVDEVRTCIQGARAELEKAQGLLLAARG